jgi:hypothetical protein
VPILRLGRGPQRIDKHQREKSHDQSPWLAYSLA